MIKLFDPENKFWQFLNKVTDAALMSLLWLLTSLPLVTVGASTAAFYSYTLKQVTNQEGSLVKSYFSAFRAHFKRATLLWLLQAAGTAFFAADLWAVWNFLLIQGGAAGSAVLGVCGFCALAFLCCCLYAYPVLAEYGLPVRQVIANSFLLAVARLHVTLTLCLLMALCLVLFYFFSGLFFFWVALYVFFSSYLIYGAFLKFPPLAAEQPEEECAGKASQSLPGDGKWLL